MTNEIEVVGKTADAVTATANATGKGIDLVSDTGGFFNKVFGGVIEDGVGLVADRLKFYRWTKAVALSDKVQAIIQARGVTDTRAVPPKVALPLIEFATIEDESELDDLWANLLASALNPSQDVVTKKFVSTLSELSGFEAATLKELVDQVGGNLSSLATARYNQNETATDLEDDAYRTLMRLGVIRPLLEKLELGSGLSGPDIIINNDTKKFKFTQFGISLTRAIGLVN